jgi:tRNA A58 N-methylase Trm61
VKFGLWIVLITLAVSNTALAQPRVTKASVSGKELRLQGNDFGAQQCRQCEVIAHFGNFKYSLDVISWNDKSIKAHLADLGKGTRASIRVVTEAGTGSGTATA